MHLGNIFAERSLRTILKYVNAARLSNFIGECFCF